MTIDTSEYEMTDRAYSTAKMEALRWSLKLVTSSLMAAGTLPDDQREQIVRGVLDMAKDENIHRKWSKPELAYFNGILEDELRDIFHASPFPEE